MSGGFSPALELLASQQGQGGQMPLPVPTSSLALGGHDLAGSARTQAGGGFVSAGGGAGVFGTSFGSASLYPASASSPRAGGYSALGPDILVSKDTGNGGEQGERQLCTFYLRTGTCAYGDRCKFRHPQDRPPPQLNSRGYPVRADEIDCAHYLKKGWCAFGPTCKFNHPELPILGPFSLASQVQVQVPQQQTTYLSVGPAGAFPGATLYTVQQPSATASAMPTLYYVPAGSAGGHQLSQQQAATLQAAQGGAFPGAAMFSTHQALSMVQPQAQMQQQAQVQVQVQPYQMTSAAFGSLGMGLGVPMAGGGGGLAGDYGAARGMSAEQQQQQLLSAVQNMRLRDVSGGSAGRSR